MTAFSKLQMQFTNFLTVFEIIENLEISVWSDKCYWYILSLMSSYYWCQWCNYAPTTKWIHKTFKHIVKNLWMVSMPNYNRKIETFWISLFESIWYRCIQDMTTVFHTWAYHRFIEIQSNIRRKKLHTTN